MTRYAGGRRLIAVNVGKANNGVVTGRNCGGMDATTAVLQRRNL
jgi:hypothetical protein